VDHLIPKIQPENMDATYCHSQTGVCLVFSLLLVDCWAHNLLWPRSDHEKSCSATSWDV